MDRASRAIGVRPNFVFSAIVIILVLWGVCAAVCIMYAEAGCNTFL
jgi:hypothetical protein